MLQITSFDPTSGPPETSVTLTVSGLDATFTVENTRVYLGEQSLHDVEQIDPAGGTIRVTIDEMCRTGRFSVQGGDDKEYVTGDQDFTVTGEHEGKPVVRGVLLPNPAVGGAYPNDTVKLMGEDLQRVWSVTLGQTRATIGARTDTQISFKVPQMEEGKYFITIKTRTGNPMKCFRQISVLRRTV
jgi:hypothetical protein